jgi:tetratricopeptide (TPR) repeat protein
MEQDSFPAMDLFQQFVRVRVAGRSEQTPEYDFIHDSVHIDGDFVFFRKRQTAQGPSPVEESVPPNTTSGGDVLSHVERGKALADQQKYAEAGAEFAQATRLDPNQAEAHARLGGSLLSEKKYAEAEAAYRNAVRLAPQSAAYRVGLGICFQYQQGGSKPKESTARR